jgi:hypothetical protein
MRMKFGPLVLVPIVALAVLALAGTGWATRRAPQHPSVVFGGGHIGPGCSTTNFCPTLPRDFSLVGRLGRHGTNALGEIVYGRNGSGNPTQFVVDVRCVAVSGNRAVLGGVIRTNGGGFAIWVIDNGVPGSSVLDQASYAQADELGSSIWPAGFPHRCPSPEGDAFGGGFFGIANGDVTVHG